MMATSTLDCCSGRCSCRLMIAFAVRCRVRWCMPGQDDPADGPVGPRAGRVQIAARRRHPQHPAAGGHAGRRPRGAVPAWNTTTSPVRAVRRRTLPSLPRPPMASPVRTLPGYPAAASTTQTEVPGAEARRLGRQPPLGGAHQPGHQIVLHAQQHRLGLGIAEAAVPLDHHRARARSASARRRAARGTAAPPRPAPAPWGRRWSRRCAPPAPRRPAATANTPPCRRCWARDRRRRTALWSSAEASSAKRSPSQKAIIETSRPGQPLLDHHPGAGGAELAVAQHLAHRRLRLGVRRGRPPRPCRRTARRP